MNAADPIPARKDYAPSEASPRRTCCFDRSAAAATPATSPPRTAAASTPSAAPARSRAFPTGTGDITLFNPAGQHGFARDRCDCGDHPAARDLPGSGNDVVSTVTFTVVALRRDAGPARQVILPYFDVALRGGSDVAAKQVGARRARISRPGASMRRRAPRRRFASIAAPRPFPPMSAQILTRPRKSGEADAAIDPLADPAFARRSPTRPLSIWSVSS